MGINMDMRNKNDFEFIDLSGLDEGIKREIKEIIRSEVASDVLKLPWDYGDRDYNSNSMVPEPSEAPNQWARYSLDESMASLEVAGSTTTIMTSPIPGTITYAPPFVHVSYPEWAMSGNAYPTGTADPNTYSYIPNVPYASHIYPATGEVVAASPNRETSGRRGRNRKGDNYSRIVNSNDIQQSYQLVQQMSPLCHGVGYMHYTVSPQQHPLFIPSPQPYSQPQIHTHHNNHPYTHPGYSAQSANMKQLSRVSAGQTYYNQETKNQSNVYNKSHERKVQDGHITAQQPFRQLPNNTDHELPKRSKSSLANNGNSINNGHTSGTVVKQIVNDKASSPASKMIESKIGNTTNDQTAPAQIEPIPELVPVSRDAKPVQEDTCPSVCDTELPLNPAIIESVTASIVKINGEEINDVIQPKPLPEPLATSAETKPTQVPCTSSSPLPPTQSSFSSATERTFASILKKKSTDILSPVTNKPPSRYGPSEVAVNQHDTTSKPSQQDSFKRQSNLGSVPLDNESSPKISNESPLNGRKKVSTDAGQMPLCDPVAHRMGEFLLVYQMDKQTVSLLPRGLTNRSNYCYINSILQALLACPPFYNLLKALPYPKNSSSKNSSTPLIDNMVRFVNEFMPLSEAARLPRKDLRAQKKNDDVVADIQAGIAFEPAYVYTMLKNASCAGVFSIEGRQEDAEEFLSCLLNGISDEMLELMKQVGDETSATEESNLNYSSGDEEWKVMGPRNKGSITRCTEFGRTPLSDIFRGQLRSKILRQGEQSTDNVQPFFTLQLDIENAESVKSALEILVGKDQVEGMTCSKTKQQIKAWKQVTLEELPVILILHLKWFDYKLDGCSKIFKSVNYSIDLKVDSKLLTQNVGKKLGPKQKQYKLFAVTYHDGKEATKGHYVTDAFHVGYGAWVRYDDSSVRGISENDVLNPTIPRVPYLLYYRRCDTIGYNQPNNARTR